MTSVEDWELVSRAACGDKDAFALLVRRYQRPIIHFCYRMTGSLPDAEDVAQETFVNLYRSLGRLRRESAFSTLVFCYARNAALNHLRGAGRLQRRQDAYRREQTGAGSSAGRPDTQAQVKDLSAGIEAGLAALAPEFREVIVLREFQGLDYRNIAEVIGCPVGTVRSRLARAREQVRLYLVNIYGEEAF